VIRIKSTAIKSETALRKHGANATSCTATWQGKSISKGTQTITAIGIVIARLKINAPNYNSNTTINGQGASINSEQLYPLDGLLVDRAAARSLSVPSIITAP
jgi:hypothetical protein